MLGLWSYWSQKAHLSTEGERVYTAAWPGRCSREAKGGRAGAEIEGEVYRGVTRPGLGGKSLKVASCVAVVQAFRRALMLLCYCCATSIFLRMMCAHHSFFCGMTQNLGHGRMPRCHDQVETEQWSPCTFCPSQLPRCILRVNTPKEARRGPRDANKAVRSLNFTGNKQVCAFWFAWRLCRSCV